MTLEEQKERNTRISASTIKSRLMFEYIQCFSANLPMTDNSLWWQLTVIKNCFMGQFCLFVKLIWCYVDLPSEIPLNCVLKMSVHISFWLFIASWWRWRSDLPGSEFHLVNRPNMKHLLLFCVTAPLCDLSCWISVGFLALLWSQIKLLSNLYVFLTCNNYVQPMFELFQHKVSLSDRVLYFCFPAFTFLKVCPVLSIPHHICSSLGLQHKCLSETLSAEGEDYKCTAPSKRG